MLWAKAERLYIDVILKTCNGKTERTQNSTLLQVPDISASQSYLNSCDAQWLSSQFLAYCTNSVASVCRL